MVTINNLFMLYLVTNNTTLGLINFVDLFKGDNVIITRTTLVTCRIKSIGYL